MVWGTFFRDEVPQSARLSAGGVQSLKGQCPNAFGIFFGVASLSIGNLFSFLFLVYVICTLLPGFASSSLCDKSNMLVHLLDECGTTCTTWHHMPVHLLDERGTTHLLDDHTDHTSIR